MKETGEIKDISTKINNHNKIEHIETNRECLSVFGVFALFYESPVLSATLHGTQ